MLHAVIKDADVGYENKELKNPTKRTGARGIVVNSNNKIAVFYKKNKNEYKLPGGGVEEGEDLEEAFCREVMEETGCNVDIIKKLGTTQEYKGNSNFYQISHVYLAKVTSDTKKLHLTEKEEAEGALLLWLNLDDAIEKVKNCFSSLKPSSVDKNSNVYSTKFVVKRDLAILQWFKSHIKDFSIEL